jgi:Chaperone of endosialidase
MKRMALGSATLLWALSFAPSARAASCSQNDATCYGWTETGNNSIAIYGEARGTGVSHGIEGFSAVNNASSAGVLGYSTYGNGVLGQTPLTGLNGVEGDTSSRSASGVYGYNSSGYGYGVAGRASNYGYAVYGDNVSSLGYAGFFNGNVYATGVYYGSDARLKTDIKDMPYGLEQVIKLRPVTYKWKDGRSDKKQLGLLAQDVESVVPEVIGHSGNSDMLSINYTALLPVMIKAVQEQQKVIEGQQARIAKLEAGRAPVMSSVLGGRIGEGFVLGLVPLGLLVGLRRRRAI